MILLAALRLPLNHLVSILLLLRIPLKKFRSIRRELTDSGRKVEELLADTHSLKYNFGFPASNGPTPETLKNYLDVSTTVKTTGPLPGLVSLMQRSEADYSRWRRPQRSSCCGHTHLFPVNPPCSVQNQAYLSVPVNPPLDPV